MVRETGVPRYKFLITNESNFTYNVDLPPNGLKTGSRSNSITSQSNTEKVKLYSAPRLKPGFSVKFHVLSIVLHNDSAY